MTTLQDVCTLVIAKQDVQETVFFPLMSLCIRNDPGSCGSFFAITKIETSRNVAILSYQVKLADLLRG